MKIGVLGGTFDPPHRGHSWIGVEVARCLGLDQVLLMVANQPPHKVGVPRADGYDRYAMAVLETLDHPTLAASSWELRETEVSYTVNTMRALRAAHPEHDFCFLGGGDSLAELPSWKAWRELAEENPVVFVRRSDAAVEVPPAVRRKLDEVGPEEAGPEDPAAGRILLLGLTPPAISSSSLRAQLAQGRQPAGEFLSPAVYSYIRKYRLYGHNPAAGQESLFDR